jgi:hypothetical protein
MSAYAQKEYEYVSFPTADAIWSEVYHFNENDWQPALYERFIINGEDTVINETVYKKIYMFFDSVFDKNTARYIGALREDEHKRVWLKMDNPLHPSKPFSFNNNEDILLYDFSVNEGDTIKFEYLNIQKMGESVVVDKIDTVKIGNTYRKKIKIKTDEWIELEWIEGIGSLNGLFFASALLTTTCHCEKNFLIGFKHKDELLYFNNDYPSFFPTDIPEYKINSDNVRLVSMPGTGFMFEFADKDDISVIQIFNITGILQTSLKKDFFLNTNSFMPGIYIYKAIYKTGSYHVGKLVFK